MELIRRGRRASSEGLNLIGKPVVTLRMVAAGANFHPSTVSLALRNDPRLPAETRRRIHEVARRMGYAPNPLVSALMSQVTKRKVGYRGTLAYLHTLAPKDSRFGYRVYRNYRAGAGRRAGEL